MSFTKASKDAGLDADLDTDEEKGVIAQELNPLLSGLSDEPKVAGIHLSVWLLSKVYKNSRP